MFLCTFAAKPDGNSVSNLLLRPNLKKNNVYDTVTIDGFSLKIKLTVNDFKGNLTFPSKDEGIVNKCLPITEKAV